jgi:hypothetical protein
MTKDLSLGKHRRARVWLAELPDAQVQAEQILTFSIGAQGRSVESTRQAGLELFIPVGPRTMYGLLAGTLTPGTEARLEVQIAISERQEQLYRETMAMGYEHVCVGLPYEYAKALEQVVLATAKQLKSLPVGKLWIDYAAHGRVGSNQRIFEHLTICLLKLLAMESADLSDADLLTIFPNSFTEAPENVG